MGVEKVSLKRTKNNQKPPENQENRPNGAQRAGA
jgi:hypothetical protein